MTKEEFTQKWDCEHRWAPAHRGPDEYCIKCGKLNCEPDLLSDLRSVIRGELLKYSEKLNIKMIERQLCVRIETKDVNEFLNNNQ